MRPRLPRAAGRIRAAPPPAVDLSGLRERLAGSGDREAVTLDLLEDDLSEARSALAAVADHLAQVEAALEALPSGAALRELAEAGEPLDRLEVLTEALASMRRRLGRLAERL